ncbi:queuosine precursor transporter [Chlamydia sp. 2742-308]
MLGIFCTSRGKAWLTGWLSLLSVIANIFVLKQVSLWGLEVTSADVYMVGLLTSLNYARELYSKESVGDAMLGSWFISIAFLILTHLHLALVPSSSDTTQKHFQALFSSTPRVIFASLVTMISVQILDVKLFVYLQKAFRYKYFGVRSALSLFISQLVDTVLFSFLGLYGYVAHLSHVILFALVIKGVVIVLSIPTVVCARVIKKRYLS